MTGACLLFDTVRLRRLLFGTGLGLKFVDFFFSVALFVLILRQARSKLGSGVQPTGVLETVSNNGIVLPNDNLQKYKQYHIENGRGLEYANSIVQATHF